VHYHDLPPGQRQGRTYISCLAKIPTTDTCKAAPAAMLPVAAATAAGYWAM
jgi:hypothetical protein